MTHDDRTIIVLTRLSEDTLHVTYLNDLIADEPYTMTMSLHNFLEIIPAGVEMEDIPSVGYTKTVVNR